MRRQVLATDVRERLVDAADAVLGERFRPPPGRRPDPYDDGVVISAHTIGERCPRRATTPALDYVDSVATVRRRIGLLALRRAAVARPPSARSQRSVPTLAAALPDEVERTLADPTEWPPRLWDWVSSLSPPARAAVSAAVVTWCDGAVRLVGDPDRIVWSDPVRTPRWDLPGRSVALTAAFDARHGTPRAGERLLVLSDATSPSQRRIRAAHVALVHTLGTRSRPGAGDGRVTGVRAHVGGRGRRRAPHARGGPGRRAPGSAVRSGPGAGLPGQRVPALPPARRLPRGSSPPRPLSRRAVGPDQPGAGSGSEPRT